MCALCAPGFLFSYWKEWEDGEVSHLPECKRLFDPGRAGNGLNVRTMRTRFPFSCWKEWEDGDVSHLPKCKGLFDPDRAGNGSNVRTMRTRFPFFALEGLGRRLSW